MKAKKCALCDVTGAPWDEIDGLPLCPDCMEDLAAGKAQATQFMVWRSEPCCVCQRLGSVKFATTPLQTIKPLVATLPFCPLHLRALIGRSLDCRDFALLIGFLDQFFLAPSQIFLLHEAFYDRAGKAIQPVDSFYLENNT